MGTHPFNVLGHTSSRNVPWNVPVKSTSIEQYFCITQLFAPLLVSEVNIRVPATLNRAVYGTLGVLAGCKGAFFDALQAVFLYHIFQEQLLPHPL